MSLSTNQSIVRGRFTSNGTSQDVPLPWLANRFELLNITQFADPTAANADVMTAEWSEGMPVNSVITGNKTNGAATIQILALNITEGVQMIDTSIQAPEAAGNAITAITNANPAVVSKVAHGYVVNDRVRIFGTTAMLEIAGYDFTVTAVPGANSFTLGFLDASGFLAAATAGTARRLPNNPIYFPRRLFVTGISAAASAVVTMSVTHGMSVGQIVRMKVPAGWGMVEIDGLQGEITAVSVANNTITLDIDSTAFTAFAFPTSAVAAAAIDQPLVVPFGDAGDVLAGAQDNQATFLARLGTNAIGANNDVMEWVATRSLAI